MKLISGCRVRYRLNPKLVGIVAHEPTFGAAIVYWDNGSEQLCYLSDLQVIR